MPQHQGSGSAQQRSSIGTEDGTEEQIDEGSEEQLEKGMDIYKTLSSMPKEDLPDMFASSFMD